MESIRPIFLWVSLFVPPETMGVLNFPHPNFLQFLKFSEEIYLAIF